VGISFLNAALLVLFGVVELHLARIKLPLTLLNSVPFGKFNKTDKEGYFGSSVFLMELSWDEF